MSYRNRRNAARAMWAVTILAMAACFTGCAAASAEKAERADKLPSVTEYSAEAESVRMAETEVTEVTVVAETQTILSPSAASFDEDENNEAAESVLAAISEAMMEAAAENASDTDEETAPEDVETCHDIPVPMADTVPSDTSDITVQSTAPSETAVQTTSDEPVRTAAQTTVQKVTYTKLSEEYDPEFFGSDLFIGDSITTGYSLYGFLPEKNVYAKIGLNPSTALTKAVSTCYGDITINTMLSYTDPARVYIMLGSNGIQWLSCSNMLGSVEKLTVIINTVCPDAEIVFIGVPPVTAGYDNTVPDVNVMLKIDEYNSFLKKFCEENDMCFVDTSKLKDSTGYFSTVYAESDGMHFKSSAYKVMLSNIQTTVEAFEAERAKPEEAESEEETEINEAETEETTAETSLEVTETETSETNYYQKKPSKKKSDE